MSNFNIPSTPLFTLAVFGRDRESYPNVLQGHPVGLYTSARYAQFALMQAMRLGEGDEVLLPSYHCEAVVGPVLALNATPRFYPLNEDLSIDVSYLEALLTPATRLIIATHFFGWLQDFRALRALCDTKGVVLLEDCAHAFFGERDGVIVGSTGHYAMTSLLKWFGMVDGGALVSNRDAGITLPPLRSPGRSFALKAAFNAVERARDFGYLPMLAPIVALKNWAMRSGGGSGSSESHGEEVNRIDTPHHSLVSEGSLGGLAAAHNAGATFETAWANILLCAPSQWIFQHTSQRSIRAGRRRVYAALCAALAHSRSVRPILRPMTESEVPYALPVFAVDVDTVVERLKEARLPYMRWDRLYTSFDPETCAVAKRYAKHLLHIPCLESYGEAEVKLWAEALS